MELAKTNLQKAKDEAAGMKNFVDYFSCQLLHLFSDSNVALFRNYETGFGEEGL